jgi:5'-deoxynucleotidase YfbR-like HD superfamily hydrolase
MEDENKEVTKQETETKEENKNPIVQNLINNGVSAEELKSVLQEVLGDKDAERKAAEEREKAIVSYFDKIVH